MQISSTELVYDVEISQLGRKNLAFRFNLIRIKLTAAPKTSVAGEILRGAWDRYQAWSATKVTSMPSKLIRPCSSMVRIVVPVTQRSQKDDSPEQGGQDDYEPDVAARAAPAANQKAAKESFSPAAQAPCAQCRGEQFDTVAVSCLLRVNELGRCLGQGRSARRISAPAPGSGDRRAGQFALAKGKLHGLLSGAEP